MFSTDSRISQVVSTVAEIEATCSAYPSAAGVSHSAQEVSSSVISANFVSNASSSANLGSKQSRPSRQGKQVPRWTPEEEERLRILVGDIEPRGRWNEIAEKLGNDRSAMSVEQHWCAGKFKGTRKPFRHQLTHHHAMRPQANHDRQAQKAPVSQKG